MPEGDGIDAIALRHHLDAQGDPRQVTSAEPPAGRTPGTPGAAHIWPPHLVVVARQLLGAVHGHPKHPGLRVRGMLRRRGRCVACRAGPTSRIGSHGLTNAETSSVEPFRRWGLEIARYSFSTGLRVFAGHASAPAG